MLEYNLQVAIQKLYSTFARYKSSEQMDYCSHCINQYEVKHLFIKAKQDLTIDDLEKYGFKAITTWGNIDDFKYFLPRLFELIAFEENNSKLYPEIIFEKLELANWREWQKEEQNGIEEYFVEL